jgi:hypothetical protein
VQQLELLGNKVDGEDGHAGEVATRPCQARDQAVLDRVDAGLEYDWNGRDCRLRGNRSGIADCHDHRRATAGQLDGQLGQPLVSALRRSIFERDILAFDEARCIQSPLNGGETETPGLLRAAGKDADHRHRRLLRARRERPRCCRAAEHRHKLAPSYVEHGGFLAQSVRRTLSLPQNGGRVAAVHCLLDRLLPSSRCLPLPSPSCG